MKISQANVGDVLRSKDGKYIVVGQNCNIKTELGSYCSYPGIYENDFEQVFPQGIRAGICYKPSIIFGNPSMGFKHPVKFILAEVGGPCQGYRYQNPITDYSCKVGFYSQSSDPRVKSFFANWTISSGQFWTKIEGAMSCFFGWKDNLPLLHLDYSGTSWYDVKAQ